jgi:hypothetical protein
MLGGDASDGAATRGLPARAMTALPATVMKGIVDNLVVTTHVIQIFTDFLSNERTFG